MNLATPAGVQKMQTALHAKAKEASSFRFYALYDKVCREDVLGFAYQCCRANGGGAGVDNQSFEDIEAYRVKRWLEEPAQELKRRTYRPLPVRRVYIAKPDGRQRPLGVPAIRDRVAQTAAAPVLEPIFEADLQTEQSFETTLLTQADNLAGPATLNRELIARADAIARLRGVVLDLDNTEIPVHGQQEQSAHNRHFASTCHHPPLLFNRGGDCLAARLRPGKAHSAEGWAELLLPQIKLARRNELEVQSCVQTGSQTTLISGVAVGISAAVNSGSGH